MWPASVPRFLDDFCRNTSLHGWSFCFRPDKPPGHTLFWLVVQAGALTAIVLMLKTSVEDFAGATVSYELESSSVGLDQVAFPNAVICNMNLIRKSYILAVQEELEEEGILGNESYAGLVELIHTYMLYGKAWTDPRCKVARRIMGGKHTTQLFKEFLRTHLNGSKLLPEQVHTPLGKANLVWQPPDTQAVLEGHEMLSGSDYGAHLLNQLLPSMLKQFRFGELILWANFPGEEIHYRDGYLTDVSEFCVRIHPFTMRYGEGSVVTYGTSHGKQNGLSLLLDLETYDNAYTMDGSEGAFLAVAHPMDAVLMRQNGLALEAGKKISVAVSPVLSDATSGARARFSPGERKCYFEDEVSMNHLPREKDYRYTQSSCFFEASLQEAVGFCNCTLHQYASKSEIRNNVTFCEDSNRRCLLDQLENVGDHKFFFDGDDEERKECLPACKEQRHYLAISQSKFPSKQTFHLSEFSQLILRRLIHACAGDRRRSLDRYKPQLCRSLEAVMESENGSLTWAYYRFRHGSEEKDERLAQLRRDLSDYASDNLVSLYVYLKDPVVKRFLTREKISWVSFVGSIGGVLGLFSGFSVISLIELVYLTSIFRKE